MAHTLTGTVQGQRVRHTVNDEPITIGRSGTCTINVPALSVSREHARVSLVDDRVTVEDLGSRNGTWVNGNRIAGRTTLNAADTIEIGGVVFELESDDAAPKTIFAQETEMGTSSTVNWKEIYGGISTGTGTAAAYRKLNLFQVLAEAGELLTSQRPLEELFEVTLDLVEKGVSAERTVLLLIEEGGSEPVVKAHRTRQGQTTDQIMLSKTMVEKVVTERSSILTHDAKADPRFEKQQSIILQGTRSAMAAPLFDNENVVGVLYADTTDVTMRYSKDELRTFTILANLVGVKITQARAAAAHEANRRMEQELATAKGILESILPDRLDGAEGYEFHHFQEPCLTVGGDLYDARKLPDGRIAIVMGDVTGKGLGAALLVSNIMASLTLLIEDVDDPVDLVTRLNRQVYRCTDMVHSATFFFGVLDPATGSISYVNAGHNPPLLVDPSGAIREIESTGVPVGMFEDMPYERGTVELTHGAFLTLYSDGIPDAEAPDGADYGMERLETVLRTEREKPARDIVGAMHRDVKTFLQHNLPNDDVTILLVRRLPPSQASGADEVTHRSVGV